MDKEKRTEDQIVFMEPTAVILGGETYQIKPLVYAKSKVWKPKVVALWQKLPELVGVNSDDSDAFGAALQTMLVDSPEAVVDLFFEYAKDLDRDEIEGKATELELAVAFQALVAVAFPLAKSLPETMGNIFQ